MHDQIRRRSRFMLAAKDDFLHADLREFSALVDRSHGSDTLVIAFANAPMPRHMATRSAYWGSAFLAGRKLDHVSLSGRAASWFRSDIVTNFLHETARDQGYARVLTYGVSKGGTGALWHAGAAGANEVFALVPQTTYGPQVLECGDDRWPTAAYHDWPPEVLSASLANVGRITVLTDTCNAFERAFLADLRALWGRAPAVVDMRYAGHDCAGLLGRQRGISALFDLVLSGVTEAAALRPITELRKRDAGYFRNLMAARRVVASPLRQRVLAGAAEARGIDPASVRMDSGYRKLRKLGRY